MWNSVISLCGLNYSGYCSADDLYPKSSREVKYKEPQSLSSRSKKLGDIKHGSPPKNSSREVKCTEPQSLSSQSNKLEYIKDASPLDRNNSSIVVTEPSSLSIRRNQVEDSKDASPPKKSSIVDTEPSSLSIRRSQVEDSKDASPPKKSSREVKYTEPQSLSSRSNKLEDIKDAIPVDLNNSSIVDTEPSSLSIRRSQVEDSKDASPPKKSIWQQASTFKLKLENNGDVEKSVSALYLLSTSNKSNCKKQLNGADHELCAKVCRSVGAIVVKYRGGEEALKGTCFRIGTQFVLTSNHVYEQVLNEAHIVESVLINFDYKEPDPSAHRVFSCDLWAVVSSGTEDLDYAVLTLHVQDGAVFPPSLTSMLSLPSVSKNLEEGRVLYFAGHPGEDETITNLFCPVQNSDTLAKIFATTLSPQHKKWLEDKNVETYNISTLKNGSSGSPGFLIKEKALMVIHTRGVCLDGHSGQSVEQGVMIPTIVADVCYKIKCGLLKYQSKELFGFERPK